MLGGVGLPAGEVVGGVASGGSGGDLLRAGFGVLGLGLALGWAWPYSFVLRFHIWAVWPIGVVLSLMLSV